MELLQLVSYANVTFQFSLTTQAPQVLTQAAKARKRHP